MKDEDEFPVVILGNKCDLEKEREVTTQEGKEFAESIKGNFGLRVRVVPERCDNLYVPLILAH